MKEKERHEEKHSHKNNDYKHKSNFWGKPKQARQFVKVKKGQMDIMVGLLMAFIVVTMLIALIPGFAEMMQVGMNSDGLNCKGTDYDNSGVIGDNALDYNATIGEKSTIGCLGMKLYLPYLVLGVLLALVGKILYGRVMSQPQTMYQ